MQIHDLILLGFVGRIDFKFLLLQINGCERVKMVFEILDCLIKEGSSILNTLAEPVVRVFHIPEIVVLPIFAALN